MDYQGFDSTRSVGRTLAGAPSFRLGELIVRPTARQVIYDGSRELLEPKVMQVLVVLADANGEVVSRDDLVARCWDGRIVGESAINRVISRVRALGSGFGRNAFVVETIAKVGYRLVIAELAQGSEPPAVVSEPGGAPAGSPIGRRAAIAVGLAAVAGLAVFVRPSAAVGPLPEADALYRKGVEAQRQGLAEQNVQAAADVVTTPSSAP